MITMINDTIWRMWHWSLLLTDRILRIGHGKFRHTEGSHTTPIHNLHPCHHGHFVHGLMGWWWCLRKEEDCYSQNGLIVKIFLCWSLYWSYRRDANIFWGACSERPIHIPLTSNSQVMLTGSKMNILMHCSKTCALEGCHSSRVTQGMAVTLGLTTLGWYLHTVHNHL